MNKSEKELTENLIKNVDPACCPIPDGITHNPALRETRGKFIGFHMQAFFQAWLNVIDGCEGLEPWEFDAYKVREKAKISIKTINSLIEQAISLKMIEKTTKRIDGKLICKYRPLELFDMKWRKRWDKAIAKG